MCFIVHIFRNYFSDICWGGNWSVWKSCRKYILTKSSKSPASIAKSNKQWVGDLLVSGGVQASSDKLRSSYLVMSK